MKKPGALISLCFLLFAGFRPLHSADSGGEKVEKSLSAFPILMYDTDIGVGYGGKAKFVHYLARKESFDFIFFNSSKGERWYVAAFSIPDIEIRQRKQYTLSLDIRAEYDKYLKYYFYGIGPGSRKENQTHFTFEKKELQVKLGRGFTPYLVVEAAYVLKNVRYFDVQEGAPFSPALKDVGERFSPFFSLIVRYDTPDSQIHPREGFRLLFQQDWAGRLSGNKSSFLRHSLDLRKYQRVFGKNDIFAVRWLIQYVSGEEVPLFELSVLGGGSEMTAMRGYPMNRFGEKGKFLLNAEYRFPIWKKLGGNLFLDGGCVWPSLSRIGDSAVVLDAGWGLRYYLHDFVVRFDMGFSREGTGIYFNFGHLF